jgi:hypothetical protein
MERQLPQNEETHKGHSLLGNTTHHVLRVIFTPGSKTPILVNIVLSMTLICSHPPLVELLKDGEVSPGNAMFRRCKRVSFLTNN